MQGWNKDGEKKKMKQKDVKYLYVCCVNNWRVKCDWWGGGCGE
jgi:hypothetical protein